ncbi:MAG: helix-turn-helix transcriptional regulator [Pseudomonadota bacterium]
MAANNRKKKGTPDPVDVHVGQRLRVRRSLLGISQEKLGNAIDLTFQQIQKYEQGMNRISAGRLYQFSKILNVPISYFFDNVVDDKKALTGLSDNAQSGFVDDSLLNSKDSLELIRAYNKISDKDVKKNIVKLVESLVEENS